MLVLLVRGTSSESDERNKTHATCHCWKCLMVLVEQAITFCIRAKATLILAVQHWCTGSAVAFQQRVGHNLEAWRFVLQTTAF